MNKKYLLAHGALLALVAGAGLACQSTTAGTATTTTATPAVATVSGEPNPPAAAPAQNAEDSMPRVRVEEAKEQVASGKGLIIDVRGTDAWKAAHIEGAIDIQLADLEKSDFKNIPKGKRIIAYCT
ncbi:MAG: rhodanese-like domain-containing protein [Acidobacteria bacterium]|nr:rhodanese-like domain-containing protein [Acidobacteriota bacterium]